MMNVSCCVVCSWTKDHQCTKPRPSFSWSENRRFYCRVSSTLNIYFHQRTKPAKKF